MGLFDKVKSEITPAFDPQKAIMTIVLSSIAADGNVDDGEISKLRLMCARSPVFASNTTDEDNDVIDFALKQITQNSSACLNQAAEALTPDLRETAFAFAVEMVMSDGMVGDDENAFITNLVGILGIAEDVALAIIQVFTILKRGV